MAFDKFAWLKAVYAETRPTPDSKKGFTDGEKAVLAHIAVFNVLTGRDTFRIRQETLAQQCGTSRKTVNSAIGRAKLLKYLTVSERHKPAPGRNTPAEWRLLMPEPCNESGHGSQANHVTENAEQCNESGHGTANHVTETAEPCNRADPPTSENDTPNSSLNSSIKENSIGGTDPVLPIAPALTGDLLPAKQTDDPLPAPLPYLPSTPSAYQLTQDEPPPLFCPKHDPDGPNGECGGCGDQRRKCDRWDKTPQGIEYRRRHHVVDTVIRRSTKGDAQQLEINALRQRMGFPPKDIADVFAGINNRRPLPAADRKALDWLAAGRVHQVEDAEVVDEP